jgi:hypothetical protein
MFDYFRKKIEILLDAVLAPVWQWVMAASWRTKILILIVLAAVAAVVANPDVALRGISRTLVAYHVAFPKGRSLPFAANTVTSLDAAAKRLAVTVSGDLVQLNAPDVTVWSAAQSVVASRSAQLDNKPEIVAFIRGLTAPNCACWVELPEQKDAPHATFISGWVMAALAALDTPATEDELQFALHAQSSDGSWHTFTVADQPQHASTYSTAWLVIGLTEQKRKHFIPAADAHAVDGALTHAVGWLLSHRSGARWKGYPQMPSSAESESISGLALHALHLAAPERAVSLDNDWISSLPDRAIAASDGENNYVELEGANGRAIDTYVQLKLPWMLVATVDAYPQGDLLHRVRAMEWLERSLNHQSVVNAEATDSTWWRAELLYSLNYVLDHYMPDHT